MSHTELEAFERIAGAGSGLTQRQRQSCLSFRANRTFIALGCSPEKDLLTSFSWRFSEEKEPLRVSEAQAIARIPNTPRCASEIFGVRSKRTKSFKATFRTMLESSAIPDRRCSLQLTKWIPATPCRSESLKINGRSITQAPEDERVAESVRVFNGLAKTKRFSMRSISISTYDRRRIGLPEEEPRRFSRGERDRCSDPRLAD